MKKNSSIYIAGHTGFVGNALTCRLKRIGFKNLILMTRKELDLVDQRKVNKLFKDLRPEYVFLLAAKVGGIYANNTYPAEFIYQNIAIQTNVIHAAYKYGVKKLLFVGSACMYPKFCQQPMKEESLLSGYLEPTNEAYAVAKIAGIKMCQAYNQQYGTKFISVIPASLYGIKDNFTSQDSHVLSALIRKVHEAKELRKKSVFVWGSGKPKREFLYVDDFANACIFLINNYNSNEVINVGSGEDISIAELVFMIKELLDFKGKVVYNKTKPDGMPRKLLDVTKINDLGWKAKKQFKEGLKNTIEWYKKNLH